MEELQSNYQRAGAASVTFTQPGPQAGDNLLVLLAKLLWQMLAAPWGTAKSNSISTALEASKVVKASAGSLHSLTVFNSKASAQFIMIINATSVPGNGAVTLLYPVIPIAAGAIVVVDFKNPLVASTGIVVCNSSTGTFTKTLGSADCMFHAHYS